MGPLRRRPRCSATRSCARWPGSRSGRPPRRPRSPSLVALPCAQVLARYEFRGRRIVQALVVVPFVLPTVVVGAAFLALLGAREPDRASPAGQRVGDPAGPRLLQPRRRRAHRSAGCGRASTHAPRRRPAPSARRGGARFRAVTLPALRPAIASAAAITFLFTFTSFGVVRLLGSGHRTTLEVEIYRQTADLLDLPGRVGARAAPADRGRRHAPRAGPPRAPPRRGSRGPAPLPVAARRPPAARRAWVRRQPRRRWRCSSGCRSPRWSSARSAPATGTGCPRGERWPAWIRAPGCSCRRSRPWPTRCGSRRSRPSSRWCSGGWQPPRSRRSEGRVARLVDGLLLVPLGTSAVTVGFGFLIALDEPRRPARQPVAGPDRAGGDRAAVRGAHDDARCCGRSIHACTRPRPCSARRRSVPGERSTSRWSAARCSSPPRSRSPSPWASSAPPR